MFRDGRDQTLTISDSFQEGHLAYIWKGNSTGRFSCVGQLLKLKAAQNKVA